MTKQELLENIERKGGVAYKSWDVARLEKVLDSVKDNLSARITEAWVFPKGNWNTAEDWIPKITIDQKKTAYCSNDI